MSLPFRYTPVKSVGTPKPPGVKVCAECGLRGEVTEAKAYQAYYRRRYVCKCKQRWTTYEVREEFVDHE